MIFMTFINNKIYKENKMDNSSKDIQKHIITYQFLISCESIMVIYLCNVFS